MIVECVVTTIDRRGIVNTAPMGPTIDESESFDRFTLRPYQSSKTFANLNETRSGVLHVSDDVLLFAKAAVSEIDASTLDTQPARAVRGLILKNCKRYYEFVVDSIDDREPRAIVAARTVATGRFGDFVGFNRAAHAVIEAAILATRVDLLPHETIEADFARLRTIVDKTGGTRAATAFAFLEDYVKNHEYQKLNNKELSQ
jgi:hypothetical protein